MDNIITNFNDVSFFSSKFPGATSLIVLPFATAAQNQPTTASYGFCMVYYGANSGVFEQVYFNANGKIFMRNHGADWGAWLEK